MARLISRRFPFLIANNPQCILWGFQALYQRANSPSRWWHCWTRLESLPILNLLYSSLGLKNCILLVTSKVQSTQQEKMLVYWEEVLICSYWICATSIGPACPLSSLNSRVFCHAFQMLCVRVSTRMDCLSIISDGVESKFTTDCPGQ